jgi:aryl carrier-like protein
MWNPGMRQKIMQAMQTYQQYQPKPIDKPVENPNIIKMHKPKLEKPTRAPREALRVVLDSIRPGFQEIGNLFEQGLTSYNVMQMVTRAGEQGYVLTMRDIISEPTFEAIASKMKTEG